MDWRDACPTNPYEARTYFLILFLVFRCISGKLFSFSSCPFKNYLFTWLFEYESKASRPYYHMVCNYKTNHPGKKHFVKSVNTVRLYSAVVTYCFVWTADIEGGKGTGGESIYGPFFEGSTLYIADCQCSTMGIAVSCTVFIYFVTQLLLPEVAWLAGHTIFHSNVAWHLLAGHTFVPQDCPMSQKHVSIFFLTY